MLKRYDKTLGTLGIGAAGGFIVAFSQMLSEEYGKIVLVCFGTAYIIVALLVGPKILK